MYNRFLKSYKTSSCMKLSANHFSYHLWVVEPHFLIVKLIALINQLQTVFIPSAIFEMIWTSIAFICLSNSPAILSFVHGLMTSVQK